MTTYRRIVATTAALSLAACFDLTGPGRTDVVVTVEPDAVVIENRLTERIHHNVMDASFAVRALWKPCADPSCPGIEPGASRRVPAGEVGGWRESDQLIVYWWHLVPTGDGGFQPDSVRAVTVNY